MTWLKFDTLLDYLKIKQVYKIKANKLNKFESPCNTYSSKCLRPVCGQL